MINVNKMPYVAVEINEILKYMSEDILNKIPNNVKSYFSNIASKDYTFKFDESKPLDEQKIQKETKEMLAIIYKDYVCNEQERRVFIEKRKNIDYEIEEEKRKKYDVNNIFENKTYNKEVKNNSENEVLIVKEKSNIFSKLISLINRILKK